MHTIWYAVTMTYQGVEYWMDLNAVYSTFHRTQTANCLTSDQEHADMRLMLAVVDVDIRIEGFRYLFLTLPVVPTVREVEFVTA